MPCRHRQCDVVGGPAAAIQLPCLHFNDTSQTLMARNRDRHGRGDTDNRHALREIPNVVHIVANVWPIALDAPARAAEMMGSRICLLPILNGTQLAGGDVAAASPISMLAESSQGNPREWVHTLWFSSSNVVCFARG